MSVTPLGVTSGSRERSAQPHELSTSTELRVVRQPPSGVSRRREALAVAVPTLLLGLAVALVDGLTVLPLACAVLCAGLAGLRTPEPGRGHTARSLVRADSATAGLLGLGLAVAGVVELVSLTDVRWGLAVVATSLVASAALRFLRVPEDSMRRVVLVGAREDIETYTSAVRDPGLLVLGPASSSTRCRPVQPTPRWASRSRPASTPSRRWCPRSGPTRSSCCPAAMSTARSSAGSPEPSVTSRSRSPWSARSRRSPATGCDPPSSVAPPCSASTRSGPRRSHCGSRRSSTGSAPA